MDFRDILSSCFRRIAYPMLSSGALYYPGMIIVRTSRWMRKAFYSPSAAPEWRIVRFAGHLRMKVDRNSYMGGSIYWCGFHHLQEMLYLRRRLTPDMGFVDVGANQGEFSLYAASRLREGQVISFEPVTKLRQVLIDNIQLNGFRTVEVHAFGLSDKKGSLPIYTSTETDIHFGRHEGLSTLYPSSSRNVLEETIELCGFDDVVMPATGRDYFLKIDVEGAELFVLRGMRRFLEKFHPEILMEINEETFNNAGYSTREIISFLNEFGYQPYKIKRGYIRRVRVEELSAWGNYIFKAGA